MVGSLLPHPPKYLTPERTFSIEKCTSSVSNKHTLFKILILELKFFLVEDFQAGVNYQGIIENTSILRYLF